MQFGIHLPQYGRAAGPDAVAAVAAAADRLGFADVWVSDHIVHPAEQGYPSPYLYDPIVTLTWAAASSERVRLGTSVLIAPMRTTLETANWAASLDAMSGGRMLLGIGVGWSEREYEALGYSFSDRGKRVDEILDVLRAAWSEDPVTYQGEYHSIRDIRVLPKPAQDRIPIWVGGGVEAAYRRAVEKGDGYQFVGKKPHEVVDVVKRLRRDRPEPEFTISLRTGWDPQGMDPAEIRDEHAAFAEAGIQHIVSAPWRQTGDDWVKSMELLAEIVMA